MEEWKPIPRKPTYSVSNLGRVKGPSGNILVATPTGKGYPALSLGRDVKEYVHRCVASAFIGDLPKGMEVNHKNGIKADNRLENLEIVTVSDNKRHAWQVLVCFSERKRDTRGIGHPGARLTEADVREIRGSSEPADALADKFKITRAHVNQIIARKRWAHLD